MRELPQHVELGSRLGEGMIQLRPKSARASGAQVGRVAPDSEVGAFGEGKAVLRRRAHIWWSRPTVNDDRPMQSRSPVTTEVPAFSATHYPA
jgi:hypothetical protein